MAIEVKLRQESKGDQVMTIPLFVNGRPMQLNEPLPAPKAKRLAQALTKDEIIFTIEDRTGEPSMIGRGPGRPRTTGRTAMAGGGSDASLTAGMTRGGNNNRAATTTTTMPRKRGRPRRTPIS